MAYEKIYQASMFVGINFEMDRCHVFSPTILIQRILSSGGCRQIASSSTRTRSVVWNGNLLLCVALHMDETTTILFWFVTHFQLTPSAVTLLFVDMWPVTWSATRLIWDGRFIVSSSITMSTIPLLPASKRLGFSSSVLRRWNEARSFNATDAKSFHTRLLNARINTDTFNVSPITLLEIVHEMQMTNCQSLA